MTRHKEIFTGKFTRTAVATGCIFFASSVNSRRSTKMILDPAAIQQAA